jgi:hypothetical protein
MHMFANGPSSRPTTKVIATRKPGAADQPIREASRPIAGPWLAVGSKGAFVANCTM